MGSMLLSASPKSAVILLGNYQSRSYRNRKATGSPESEQVLLEGRKMSNRVVTLMLLFVVASTLFVVAGAHAQIITPHQTITVDPGDYILQPGIPQCGDHRDTRVGETVDAVTTLLARSKGWSATLAKVGGAFAGQFVTELQKEVARGTSGSIAQFFNDIGVSPRYATCGTVVLVAPEGWHFVDAKGGAHDLGQESLEGTPEALCDVPNEPYVKCHVPDAAWMIVRGPKVIVGTFVNWARETRVAGLGGVAVPDNPAQFSQPAGSFGGGLPMIPTELFGEQ
jgi:hypothetical protein